MVTQPTLDERAEAKHPPRSPRFGRRQRTVLRLLAAAIDNDLDRTIFTPAERRAADRLVDRGFVGRAGAIYYLTTKEVN